MPLEQLKEAIDRIEGAGGRAVERRGVASGWGEIDGLFAGGRLPVGVLQEWYADGSSGSPLPVLTHLVERAAPGACVWVGRSCWPYAPRLSRGVTRRSVFVSPRDTGSRVWAVGLCLSSPAVAAVVADGSGFTLAATRRLQLSARAGGALVLLARPESELGELSAAAVRWRVKPAPSPTPSPRWSVELLRCKGLRPALLPQKWTLEETDAAGVVLVPADVADRPAATPAGRLRLA